MKKQFWIPIALMLLANSIECFSQLVTNNSVALTITNGAQVTIKGSLLNNAGTTINNSGTIDLTGNWTNNSGNNCFAVSAGTVIMNGAAQSIGGNDLTLFHHLQLQGTGTKTLLTDIATGGSGATPSGILSLDELLDLNSNTLLITNPDPDAIIVWSGSIRSEQTDNSSKVDWDMKGVTGNHVVPFSNNAGTLIPFTYNLAGGFHGHVTMSTYKTNAMNLPYPVLPSAVSDISSLGDGNPMNAVDRYWEVDAENPGSLSELTFTFDLASENGFSTGQLLAQRWDNTGIWLAPLPTQNEINPNVIHMYNNTGYGTFGLGTGASPLPISLLSFTAKLNSKKHVDVAWVTLTETNNDYFTVERSGNGIDFKGIAEKDGAGNSTTALHYSEKDMNPLKGISYYRLKQTDFDGAFSYSDVVPVNNTGSSGDVLVYPNPATEYILISFNPGEIIPAECQFELYDSNGKKVMGGALSTFTTVTENTFRVNRNGIANGSYIFRLLSNDEVKAEGKITFN